MALKEEILLAIYNEFTVWSQKMESVCEKGCAACCTQNVTMTAVEGDLIHAHIREQGQEEWFAARLQQKGRMSQPQLTINQFAARCLAGEDVEPDRFGNLEPCPFLKDNCCLIYPVRPFSCRSFTSRSLCGPGVPAQVTDSYLSGVTAVLQVIEHLGQGEYWGNMLDVLAALSDLPENRGYVGLLPAAFAGLARANLVSARPLPGFLIPEEEWAEVEPLLLGIFGHRIGEKTIEDILNNR